MSTRNYRYIIIDDHPTIIEGVKYILSAEDDFRFVAAFTSTRAALNTNFTESPDVIILDLNMPDLDGEKSYPLLKSKFPSCKILAFTQFSTRSRELRKLGFDGYVTKTDGSDILIHALRSVLNGSNYFSESNKGYVSSREETDPFLTIKLLTRRELEISFLVVEGYTNKEIGMRIHIAESTVETYRKRIKAKLKVKSSGEMYLLLKDYWNGKEFYLRRPSKQE
jgi:DNA-binding NarL/FixJ family response regulator